MSKYHPGLANSKTESLVNDEVDRLMQLKKVTEQDLLEVEAKVRKQSNEEIAMISTNPFKRVTSFKSGAKDEWAIMNELVVKAGLEVSLHRCGICAHRLPTEPCACPGREQEGRREAEPEVRFQAAARQAARAVPPSKRGRRAGAQDGVRQDPNRRQELHPGARRPIQRARRLAVCAHHTGAVV